MKNSVNLGEAQAGLEKARKESRAANTAMEKAITLAEAKQATLDAAQRSFDDACRSVRRG